MLCLAKVQISYSYPVLCSELYCEDWELVKGCCKRSRLVKPTFLRLNSGLIAGVNKLYKKALVPWHEDWCLCSAQWEFITNTPSTKSVLTLCSTHDHGLSSKPISDVTWIVAQSLHYFEYGNISWLHERFKFGARVPEGFSLVKVIVVEAIIAAEPQGWLFSWAVLTGSVHCHCSEFMVMAQNTLLVFNLNSWFHLIKSQFGLMMKANCPKQNPDRTDGLVLME